MLPQTQLAANDEPQGSLQTAFGFARAARLKKSKAEIE
jgi:hypothetical protein